MSVKIYLILSNKLCKTSRLRWNVCVSVLYNDTFLCTMYVYRNSAQGSEHEVYPTIQMRHAALERNKRCLLTYL